MRYAALAVDYDETLAEHGRVAPATQAALERARATGRRLVLVTGRQLSDLLRVFPGIDIFDRVVAENGAVLYLPASRQEIVLASPPPEGFVKRLSEKGVAPLSVGKVIVATTRSHETTVLQTIREMGLELQIIFNGDAVMVLPTGTDKSSGLKTAVQQLGLSLHEVVGVGNSENDHSLLEVCGCGVAVANAIDSLQSTAAYVTRGAAGNGVIEVIDALIASNLAGLPTKADWK